MPLSAVVAALVAVLVWGYAFLGNRELLDHLDAGPAAALRYLITVASLLPVMVLKRMPLPRWADVPRLLIAGVVGIAVYSELLFAGQARSTVSVASVLVQLAPLFAVLGAWALAGEHPTRWTWLGLGVALSGVAVISGLDPRQVLTSQAAGVACLVGAAACWGLYQVVLKPLFPSMGVLPATCWALVIGTTGLAALHGMTLTRQAAQMPASAWGHAVALGLGAGTVGFLAWSLALSRAPTNRVASFLFLVPVVAVALAHGLRNEPITPLIVGGAVLIILGVACAHRGST